MPIATLMTSKQRLGIINIGTHPEKVGDTFNLCRLYSDWSWLLSSWRCRSVGSHERKELRLGGPRRLGTEISEYWHTRYHLTMDRGDAASAYQYLENGLESARRYQNVYMILDTLHHSVQRAAATGTPDVIPELLVQLELLEAQGCGIRQFRGRALVYYGDTFFDAGNHAMAIALWLKGLGLVAEFGNSRSNVELFNDTLAPRRDALTRFLDSVLQCTDVTEALVPWRNGAFITEFPEMMEIFAAAGL